VYIKLDHFRIFFPDNFLAENLETKRVRWAKFFSTDSAVLSPVVVEVFGKEFLLVFRANVSAENLSSGTLIGSAQLIEPSAKRQTSARNRFHGFHFGRKVSGYIYSSSRNINKSSSKNSRHKYT
jgi:hypothetical protein